MVQKFDVGLGYTRSDMDLGWQGHWVKCIFFTLIEYNSKTNDPKVFKVGIGNELGIS